MIIGQLRFGEGQTTSAVLAITIAHSLNGLWLGPGLVNTAPPHTLYTLTVCMQLEYQESILMLGFLLVAL